MPTEREKFNSVLLDEGIELSQQCPKCNSPICGFPDISLRPYKGERSEVKIWQCWHCRTEFIQVYLPQ